MRVSLVTLAFSPALGRFVDEPLRELLARFPATAVREHFFVVDSLPYLLCVVTHAPAGASSGAVPRAAPPPHAVPAAIETSADPCRSAPQQPATPVQELLQDLTAEQRQLFEQVRRWRRQTAHSEGAPPYVVLTNRQLVEIVRQRPHSRAALGEIHGLGEKKLARHGAQILAMLWPDAPPPEAPDAVAEADTTMAEAAS